MASDISRNYAETMERLKTAESEESYDEQVAAIAQRLIDQGDLEAAACIDRLLFDQQYYRKLIRKADHGCWDANCSECDKKDG